MIACPFSQQQMGDPMVYSYIRYAVVEKNGTDDFELFSLLTFAEWLGVIFLSLFYEFRSDVLKVRTIRTISLNACFYNACFYNDTDAYEYMHALFTVTFLTESYFGCLVWQI